MRQTSLNDFLADLNLKDPQSARGVKSGGPVTFWLCAEDKARYDKLQTISSKRFGKKAREILLAAIEMAESRASA